MRHITVLQKEAVSVLDLKKDSVVVDCTLGSGGHGKEITRILGEKGTYIGIDIDKSAIDENRELETHTKAKVRLVKNNFRNLEHILSKLKIQKVDAILADLGWRMEQFKGDGDDGRGFSFNEDEPLLMTFGDPAAYAFTAYDIVNEWQEEDIANIIFAYGEERFSRRIAKRIVEERAVKKIATSTELAEIVKTAVPMSSSKGKRIHPATKTFQALRIAVNDEFDALSDLLAQGLEVLNPGGRMAIITFHSLEDRIVKETFRNYARDQKAVLVHKKPIVASKEELQENKRARSAKLRTIEKI